MEISSHHEDPSQTLSSSWSYIRWFKSKLESFRIQIVEFGHTARNIAEDEPRKVIHSVKVGLAISLVSLIYYFDPLFEGFGVAAIWAVITVVVVLEFSVGATVGRGLNRVVASSLGGVLGVAAHRAASLSRESLEPVVLGSFVFLIASVVTFLRFIPKLKGRYDYGLNITILTFSLVCVSAYRSDEMFKMAYRRISTVIIGSIVAVGICICIYPVWAGQDLHDLVAANLHKLGYFLQEFGPEYFQGEPRQKICEEKRALMEEFRSILNSKSNEDSLVNLASWEPSHDRFMYHHPWHQYQKIGRLACDCAIIIHSLNRYLHADTVNTQVSIEVKAQIEQACTTMCCESGKALEELATAIKSMTHPQEQQKIVRAHIESSQLASKTVISLLRDTLLLQHEDDHENDNLLQLQATISAAAVVSLLIDVVSSVEEIAVAVFELASLARFRSRADEPMRSISIVEKMKKSLLRMGRLLVSCHHQTTIDIDMDVGYQLVSSSDRISSPTQHLEDPPSLAMAQNSAAE